MKLNDVSLCLDCDEIFSSKRSSHFIYCPACSSRNHFPIAAWLNRTKLETVYYIRGVGKRTLIDVKRYQKSGQEGA